MRKLTHSLLLCIGLTGLMQALPAQAANVTQCDEAGLRAAIADTADGGKINLNCGNGTIALSSELVLNKSLTINGQGANLDGGNRTRIFRTTKDLTLIHLTLQNGHVGSQVGNFSCEGAAVHVTFGKLLLSNVTVQNNFAPRGGAVCGNWQANVDIRQSTFTGNSAHQGGAVFTNTTDLAIRNSTFSNNSTTIGSGLNGIGGAIYTYADLDTSTPITILSSRFDGNTSFHEGGALFLTQNNGINVTVQSSTFVNNHAQLNPQTGIGSGGAIKLNHAGGQSLAKLTDVAFANNIADQEGGAIWAGGASANLNLELFKVTFYGNEAGRIPDPVKNETAGGGMILESRGSMSLVQTTFAENRANNETSGAIFIGDTVDRQKVTVRKSLFQNNCSYKDIAGTPDVENCNHFTHIRTARDTGNFQFVHHPLQGNAVFEWPINQHAPTGEAFPIIQNSAVRDVNVRPYQDNGDAAPDHPCSDINMGSGGAC
ncbi:MAG: hypothetical protein F6J87_21805 [Spirulina sp. SIO3F2]|nr:hypothetical protein [Spirulina sp. SIO3F2]